MNKTSPLFIGLFTILSLPLIIQLFVSISILEHNNKINKHKIEKQTNTTCDEELKLITLN